jgi:hypothetical protein
MTGPGPNCRHSAVSDKGDEGRDHRADRATRCEPSAAYLQTARGTRAECPRLNDRDGHFSGTDGIRITPSRSAAVGHGHSHESARFVNRSEHQRDGMLSARGHRQRFNRSSGDVNRGRPVSCPLACATRVRFVCGTIDSRCNPCHGTKSLSFASTVPITYLRTHRSTCSGRGCGGTASYSVSWSRCMRWRTSRLPRCTPLDYRYDSSMRKWPHRRAGDSGTVSSRSGRPFVAGMRASTR